MNQASFETPINFTELPYPPIHTSERNMNYERLMLDNIAGSNSELSTISLYFYNSLITNKQYPEISSAFREIMFTEIRHMEIFGTIATQLGADPRWWSWRANKNMYWTPGYNTYTMRLKDILSNAIKHENASIDKYTKQAASIRDMNIVENLHRIIIDEKKHVEIFTGLFNKYICE